MRTIYSWDDCRPLLFPSIARYFFTFRYEDFVRKEQKNASPDEEVMADSSEMKLKQVRCWVAGVNARSFWERYWEF